MTTTDQWLLNLLAQQNVSTQEFAQLTNFRDIIQRQLSTLGGYPRFYYAGSFGKKTMVRARYDLDIVIYWPQGITDTLKGIYNAVGDVLKQHYKVVNSKTVSWELPFEGGFHIDVVPGRALDANYYEANLYRTDTKTSLKTSLKKHIDTVRGSGRTDAIRLVKLWRIKKAVPFKKSFLLEMLTIEACKGIPVANVADQVWATLTYIRDNIIGCNVLDPANSNNSLSDDLTAADRQKICEAAAAAINNRSWEWIYS